MVEFCVGRGDPGLFFFVRNQGDGSVTVQACMGTKKPTFESETTFARLFKVWTSGAGIERRSRCGFVISLRRDERWDVGDAAC